MAGNQSNVTVTYHETFLDANNYLNLLVSPYFNSSNPQTIYARVENSEGLYAVSEVILEVVDCLIDNDNDGVANAQEDLNGDGNLANDDTDNDGIPNYLDDDDDGDSVDTLTEITGIGAGFTESQYTFIDTDADLIENYLDNDDDGDGILTVFEDYNNNGTPLDDDQNNNGIPDFLDPDVTVLSFFETELNTIKLYPDPTSGVVTIQSSNLTEITELTIYNLQGQVLVSDNKTHVNGNLQIDVSSFEDGVYFVRIDSVESSVIIRVIKK